MAQSAENSVGPARLRGGGGLAGWLGSGWLRTPGAGSPPAYENPGWQGVNSVCSFVFPDKFATWRGEATGREANTTKKKATNSKIESGGKSSRRLCRTLPQRGCLSIARVSRPSQGGQRSNRPGGPPRAPGAVGLPHGEAVGPAVGGGVRGRPAGHRGQRRGDMSHAGSVRGMCKTLKSEVKNHKLNFKVSYLIFILLFKFSFITLI